jgi:hypothetical protein
LVDYRLEDLMSDVESDIMIRLGRLSDHELHLLEALFDCPNCKASHGTFEGALFCEEMHR